MSITSNIKDEYLLQGTVQTIPNLISQTARMKNKIKKSLKISKGWPEAVNWRRDNKIAKRRGPKDKQWSTTHYVEN